VSVNGLGFLEWGQYYRVLYIIDDLVVAVGIKGNNAECTRKPTILKVQIGSVTIRIRKFSKVTS
jgi:hypothetical protein